MCFRKINYHFIYFSEGLYVFYANPVLPKTLRDKSLYREIQNLYTEYIRIMELWRNKKVQEESRDISRILQNIMGVTPRELLEMKHFPEYKERDLPYNEYYIQYIKEYTSLKPFREISKHKNSLNKKTLNGDLLLDTPIMFIFKGTRDTCRVHRSIGRERLLP